MGGSRPCCGADSAPRAGRGELLPPAGDGGWFCRLSCRRSAPQRLSCRERGLSKVLLGAWTQKHLVLSRLKCPGAFQVQVYSCIFLPGAGWWPE